MTIDNLYKLIISALENGNCLDHDELGHRYAAMHQLKKAKLLKGKGVV